MINPGLLLIILIKLIIIIPININTISIIIIVRNKYDDWNNFDWKSGLNKNLPNRNNPNITNNKNWLYFFRLRPITIVFSVSSGTFIYFPIYLCILICISCTIVSSFIIIYSLFIFEQSINKHVLFLFHAPKIQKKFIHLTQFAEIVVNIEKKRAMWQNKNRPDTKSERF